MQELRRDAVVTVIALLAVVGALDVVIGQESAAAEVLTSVQRHADGRTEFALQRQAGGEWSERKLPQIARVSEQFT